MKQAECEQLVDRYMSGDMSVSEEQDFFIQVAVNDELRQTLKAYRVVDTALRKDRSVPRPAGNDRSRANVMAMLAATAPIAGAGAAGSGVAADAIAHGATSASIHAGAAGSAGLISTGMAKIGAVLIAVTGLTVGTFVVGPIISDRVATTPSATSRTASPSSPSAAQNAERGASSPMMVMDSTATIHATEPETRSALVQTQTDLLPRPAAHVEERGAHRHTPVSQQPVVATPRVAAHQDSVPTTQAEAPRPVPSKVDSISFKVDIDLPDDK
jgi:hypothetical protein